MTQRTLCVIFLLSLSGCAFDVSRLNGRDSGTESDALVVDATSSNDSPDAFFVAEDSADDAFNVEDTFVAEDVGTDSPLADPDAGTEVTCTSFPDLSGIYPLNFRLRECTFVSLGSLSLIRTGACTYEFEDGSPMGSQLFDGPCTVLVSDRIMTMQCDISHRYHRFSCEVTPVSGGLNVTCRYTRGTPVITAPCSFFLPRRAT